MITSYVTARVEVRLHADHELHARQGRARRRGRRREGHQDGDDRYVGNLRARGGPHAQQANRTASTASSGSRRRWPGFDGAYLRFSGKCRVQYFRAGALVEEFADKAIWELMYFGHAR